jgi:hypothetical protein
LLLYATLDHRHYYPNLQVTAWTLHAICTLYFLADVLVWHDSNVEKEV